MQVGRRVRVCSDVKASLCGKEGTVKSLTAGNATLQLEPLKEVVTVPQAHLVPLENLQDPKTLHLKDLTNEKNADSL